MGLDRQKLLAILGAAARSPEIPEIHVFDSLPSTNQMLWNLIAEGAEAGTVVIATQQTAGRGQWGRQWISPIGGLYLSMAIAPNLPVTASYRLTLGSAWGIANQLRSGGISGVLKRAALPSFSKSWGQPARRRELPCGIPVFLKWPNDLMLLNRKLGGILTETKIHQGRIAKAVVGVGINWANPVPATGINLRSQSQVFHGWSLEMLAAATILGIISGCDRAVLEGVDTLIESYEQLLTSIGCAVEVDNRSGVVVGVTEAGNLRVRLCPKDTADKYAIAQEICLNPGTISLGYGKLTD